MLYLIYLSDLPDLSDRMKAIFSDNSVVLALGNNKKGVERQEQSEVNKNITSRHLASQYWQLYSAAREEALSAE